MSRRTKIKHPPLGCVEHGCIICRAHRRDARKLLQLVDIAVIYIEDGAPRTAIDRLREALPLAKKLTAYSQHAL